MLPHRSAIPLVTAAVVLAGCRDAVGSTPSASLDVTQPSARVVEGGSVALDVTLDGKAVSGDAVSWASRDPSTVRVEGGVARAVAPGVTYVVASRGESRDSARVTVGFRELRANVVGIRVAGATGSAAAPIQLGGGALFAEDISPSARPDHSVLFATSAPAGSSFDAATQADSVLSILLPGGRMSAGTYVIDPVQIVTNPDVHIVPSGPTTTALWIREPGGTSADRRIYVPVAKGTLELTSVEYPAVPGRVAGAVKGTVSFEAAGVTVRYNSNGTHTATPLGDRTVMVYAEFTMPLVHELVAEGAPITLVGGPNGGTYGARAVASYVDGGVTIDIPAVLGTTESSMASETRVWLPAPAAGAFDVGAAPASSIGDGRNAKWWVGDTTGGARPWVRHFAATLEVMNQTRIGEETNALSDGGTITITEFVAPGADTYGRIAGEMSVTLGYWKAGAFTGERTILRTTFAIPITPLNGAPRHQ
jgi:hypothetical protein